MSKDVTCQIKIKNLQEIGLQICSTLSLIVKSDMSNCILMLN